jgi:hypothetical protein
MNGLEFLFAMNVAGGMVGGIVTVLGLWAVQWVMDRWRR